MIKYKKGDRVKVIDDDLSGVVISISEEWIKVETELGFELDYAPNELLPDVGLEEEIIFEAPEEEEEKIVPVTPKKEKVLMDSPSKKTVSKKGNKKKKKKWRKPALEIDLHYGQLESYDKQLPVQFILNRQMAELERRMKRAKDNGYDRVVIIHGKGEGVLESEIKKWLNEMGYAFYDADFARYKLGATEVELSSF